MARMLKRRKFSRRSKPYSKRRMYKKSKRLSTRVKKVERIAKRLASDVEYKCITGSQFDLVNRALTSTPSTPTNWWNGLILNRVSQGVGGGERIGTQWVEKSILLQYKAYTNPAASTGAIATDANTMHSIRVMILRFPEVQISGTAALPTPATFLQNITGTTNSDINLLGPYKLEERPNFRVVYDKVHILHPANKQAAYVRTKLKLNNFKVRSTSTAPSSVGNFERGPLVMYAVADIEGTTTIGQALTMAWKLNYVDM